MILFKLSMALSHDEFYHPQSGEPTGSRGLAPIQVSGATQASNICIAIMIQVAFPASILLQLSRHPPKRGRELDCGKRGKSSIGKHLIF